MPDSQIRTLKHRVMPAYGEGVEGCTRSREVELDSLEVGGEVGLDLGPALSVYLQLTAS